LALGRQYDAAVVQPRREWYDYDPIHPRPWVWPTVWRELLAPLGANDETSPAPPGLPLNLSSALAPLDWLRCQTLWPDRWLLLRREMRVRQPAGRLSDGTVVELY
jgi:hypothetical protein